MPFQVLYNGLHNAKFNHSWSDGVYWYQHLKGGNPKPRKI
ncbi:hypothetical protein VIBNISO65_60015 [Vibrio nigripulchritudo SO65]|nr:hypothetical protein VIBNIAM115_1020015 [Vibrio nigripulchritudo AM115]CCN40950.1 hypothetical protein VIBNIFTn2_1400041 [Vibrio nigripulchritudo FTn2]CCN66178.1 hypothetical protein VIBNIPon4_520015 [Vibrio nigripulchritudo POn4]CCN78369.1 hypothetical protein VIBNISO65_60015 [Vibrio nigripulchritudo SO65]